MVGAPFSGYAVYKNDLTLEGRVSGIRAGSFGIEGPFTWLSDMDHGNQIRFLKWNDALRAWEEDMGIVMTHERKDNEAIDLAVAEGFNFAWLAGTLDVIAITGPGCKHAQNLPLGFRSRPFRAPWRDISGCATMRGTRFVRLVNCAVANLAGESIAANFTTGER